jgi:hypothetical protein
MAPVIPFIPLITGLAGAAATVTGAVISGRQADKAAKRQQSYYDKIAKQEAATEAEQNRITKESRDRAQAYGASLLADNTQLNNMLSGGWDDEEYSTTILNTGVQSNSVSSMFA